MKCLISIVCSVLMLLSSAAVSFAQDTSAQEAKKARLEREIAIIDKQLSENASRSNAMLSNLTLIRKKISNRKALVEESDRVIRKYSDDMYLKQRQINRMQARVDTLTAHYSRLVVSAYKNRDSRIWYMYMLASENLGQAFLQKPLVRLLLHLNKIWHLGFCFDLGKAHSHICAKLLGF